MDRFLNIQNSEDIAYKAAKAFMDEKGVDKVTDNLNTEFAGRLAEIYYKGVKEAVKEFDPGMMYLGTRLHGTPKYMKNVVEAAGRYCDIVSINYYSRWSPELDTYVKDWETWAKAPFMVTEFYTKGVEDSDLNNGSGAGLSVPRQEERAYAYQLLTLGLLEAKNCVGWHWFKYQDDDGNDNQGKPANKGVYDNGYVMYPYLSKFMQEVNYNVYNLIEYFDTSLDYKDWYYRSTPIGAVYFKNKIEQRFLAICNGIIFPIVVSLATNLILELTKLISE